MRIPVLPSAKKEQIMIRKAEEKDMEPLTALALELWPDNTAVEMQADLQIMIGQENTEFFLAYREGVPVGFAQCGLRHDYVEGTETSPVGYLEGIYVRESNRKLGIAGQLIAACEEWARAKGCAEFASDCEIDNKTSLGFHLKMGFKEANRIICFTKKL